MTTAARWYAGCVVAVIVAYVLAQWPLAAEAGIYIAVELSAATAVVIGLRRGGLRPRTAWLVLAASLAAWAVGDAFWWTYEHRGVAPFPSVAEGLFLAGYGGIAYALWRFAHHRRPTTDTGDLLDALLVTLALAVPVWLLSVRPALADASAGIPGRTVGTGYALIVLLLVLLVARFLLAGIGGDRQARLLTAAILVLVVTNLVYAAQLYQDLYSPGGWLDAGWLASFALFGLAGLQRADEPRPASTPRDSGRPPHPRILTLWAAALVPPAILLLHVARGGQDPEVLAVTGLGTGAVFTLLTIRVSQLLRTVEDTTRSEAEQRFASLLEQIRDVVTVHDRDGRITYTSPSVHGALGYLASSLPERLIDLVHPDDRPAVDAQLDRLLAGGTGASTRFEARIGRADGSWCPCVLTIANQLDHPTIAGVVTTCHDVSERAAYEQDLRERAEHEAEVARQLREVAEMKDTFLTAISHDLRTPLTSIRGMSELLSLRHDELDEGQRRALTARVAANAQRLERLLLDLLDLDRLTRGSVEPQRSPVDAAAIARTIGEQEPYRDRAIAITGDSVHAHVDPVMLERILDNLLSNAVKHTPVDAAVRVHLDALPAEGLRIVVDDDGPGIAEADRQRVLEAFSRLDSARTSAGTGIGLSLVAGFARLHRGSVMVDEGPDGGARFTVELPGPT